MFTKTLNTSLITILLFCLSVVAALAQAPPAKFAKERFVVRALQLISSTEATFQATVGNGNYGTLAQLQNVGYIDAATASGQKYGFQFDIVVTPRTQDTSPRFFVTASPTRYRKTGLRSYYLDETGEIRAADKNGTAADANDPVIETCAWWGLEDNERCTLQDMSTLHGAETTYAATSGLGNYGSLADLSTARLIRSDLADNDSRGYFYSIQIVSVQPNISPSFRISAVPRQYGVTGVRSFFIDESGVLRGADKHGQPANGDDPPINN